MWLGEKEGRVRERPFISIFPELNKKCICFCLFLDSK